MNGAYNSIIHYMDMHNFIMYSYITGKFYLINVDVLSSSLADKVWNITGKTYLNESELYEMVVNAQNPYCVDCSRFSYPIVVGIMVTNKCNLQCKYCIANYGKSYSSKDCFSNVSSIVLNELKNSSVISVMVSGGEPTLYKELSSFLTNLSKGDFLCLLDTNGVNIDDELLNVLKKTKVIPRISLDSVYENEHNANRGMFANSIKNIIRLRGEGIDLRINTVINRRNVKNLGDLAEWLCMNGISKWHLFKLQQAFAPKDIWISDDEVKDILTDLNRKYGKKMDLLFKFSKNNDGFASFVIDSEGVCFSTKNTKCGYGEKKVFGDLTQKKLSDIWMSTPMDYRIRHYNKYLSYINKEV